MDVILSMVEQKILQDLGLSEIEAKVYLACLELGTDSVLEIAKKAGVKRPTCYLSLDNLFDKGLVTKVQKKSTTLYSAQDPKVLLNKFREKITNFEDLLPYFSAKFAKGPKPKIRFYEGKEELWNVYTKILFPAKEIYFFGTDVEKIYEIFPTLFDYWLKNYLPKYNRTMEIVSYDSVGIKYAKTRPKNQNVRIMPKDLPVFADSVITENKLFIVSLDNLFGVLIESEDLAKTYINFFMLAWGSALRVEDLKKKENKIK